jgi:hypothetical protein
MSEFKPVSLGRARWLAEQFGAERIVIIATNEERFAITSYGATKAVCARLALMIKDGDFDQIAQGIADA